MKLYKICKQKLGVYPFTLLLYLKIFPYYRKLRLKGFNLIKLKKLEQVIDKIGYLKSDSENAVEDLKNYNIKILIISQDLYSPSFNIYMLEDDWMIDYAELLSLFELPNDKSIYITEKEKQYKEDLIKFWNKYKDKIIYYCDKGGLTFG